MNKNLAQWLYKIYEEAIIESAKIELTEDQHKDLLEFSKSEDNVTLYYQIARKIYYRQPMLYVKWSTKRTLKKMLRKTSLLNFVPILCEIQIDRATRFMLKNTQNYY